MPDGFPKDQALRQLVAFVKRIAPEAQGRGIVLSVEAQRKEETNIINTTAEAITWVEAVGHPSFQVMVDFYHLALEREDPAVLTRARRIAHVHFANPIGRVFPRDSSEYDYAGFFANLRKIGYRGRISIEARTSDLATDGPRAIAFLRSALASGGVRRARKLRWARQSWMNIGSAPTSVIISSAGACPGSKVGSVASTRRLRRSRPACRTAGRAGPPSATPGGPRR